MPRICLLLLVCLLAVHAKPLAAQGRAEAYIREGDRHFQQMAYARAIHAYSAAARKGAVNEHVTRRLAESHMRLGNTVEAERWYSTVVKFLNREPKDLFFFAEALKSNGRYEEAEEWMDRYLAMAGGEGAPRSNITGFARKYARDLGRFTVKPSTINSPLSDMAPVWLGNDQLLFASARSTSVAIERRAAINDQPFLDLFTVDILRDGALAQPQLLQGDVNGKWHDGPATASMDGDRLWFTRNQSERGRAVSGRMGFTRLGIYSARRGEGGFWGVRPFPFNNTEVSMGHPSLSADGQRLFFVSDMPGGQGGSDIYFCRLQDGEWSEPVNLGPSINTPGNELFPFIAADGTLYFASNGHPGLGGLDIFAAKPNGPGRFGGAINLGSPINGPKDDHGFIIDPTSSRGFFASNRPGGMGDDDIYAFEMHAPLVQEFLCTGTVIDQEYDIPVIAAQVLLFGDNGTLLDSAYTDNRGEYAFPVEKDRVYRVVARLKGRFEGEQRFSTERIEEQQIITRDIFLVADAGIWLRGAVRYTDRIGFIEGMTVSVVNLSSFFSEVQRTDAGGGFRFRLQPNEDFEVMLEKPGFFSQSIPVSTKGMRQGIIDLADIQPLEFEPIQLGEPNPLKYVRWSEGSAVLDGQAKLELDALAERLLVNPEVMVELAVHEDARGDAAVALKLSQRRAEAMVQYLREKGVAKERLAAKGYGQTRPLNHCLPGVACSEEEHAANRRSVYVVTGLTE